MNEAEVIKRTQFWISSIVIGLNLCPFAQRVFKAGQIRYVMTETDDQETLLQILSNELQALVNTPTCSVETTLLIHPLVLGKFFDYLDFLSIAEQRIRTVRLQGVIQIASFHPEYQFDGTDPEAVENYTNRSPYPMLHLLREDSISKVAHDSDNMLEIPLRNKRTLKALGRGKLLDMLKEMRE